MQFKDSKSKNQKKSQDEWKTCFQEMKNKKEWKILDLKSRVLWKNEKDASNRKTLKSLKRSMKRKFYFKNLTTNVGKYNKKRLKDRSRRRW